MFAINQSKPVNNHTKQASLQRENLINQGYKPKTCVFNSYQINLAIRPAPTERPSTNPRQGVLALTIKHTVEFSRSGRAPPSSHSQAHPHGAAVQVDLSFSGQPSPRLAQVLPAWNRLPHVFGVDVQTVSGLGTSR